MSFYSSKILVTTWKFSKFTKTCWDSSPCPAFTLLPTNCWTGISEVSALSLTSVLLTASSLPGLSLLFPVSLLFPAWRKVSVLWSRPCLCYLSVQFPALNLEWGLFNITTQAVAVVRMYCLGFLLVGCWEEWPVWASDFGLTWNLVCYTSLHLFATSLVWFWIRNAGLWRAELTDIEGHGHFTIHWIQESSDGTKCGASKYCPFPSCQHFRKYQYNNKAFCCSQSCDRIQTRMCKPIFGVNFTFIIESVCIQLYLLVFNMSKLYARKTSSGAIQDIWSLFFFWQISKPNRKFRDWKTAFELNPFERLEICWLTNALGRI